jgi:Predicted amidohydrolase
MRIAALQWDIIHGDAAANRAYVQHEVARLCAGAEAKPDVLVLPELWTTAYDYPSLSKEAEDDRQTTTLFLADLAKQHRVNIVGGSIAERREGQVYNTAKVFNRQGECVYTYSKVHLVPMFDEPEYFAAGTEPAQVFMLDGVPMGVVICYDLRFGELMRPLAVEGALVLFVVAEWPESRIGHWEALLKARAIENQQLVVAVNRVGTYDGIQFGGRSLGINALGDTLAIGDAAQESTLLVDVDTQLLSAQHDHLPVFASRRPDIYRRV